MPIRFKNAVVAICGKSTCKARYVHTYTKHDNGPSLETMGVQSAEMKALARHAGWDFGEPTSYFHVLCPEHRQKG